MSYNVCCSQKKKSLIPSHLDMMSLEDFIVQLYPNVTQFQATLGFRTTFFACSRGKLRLWKRHIVIALSCSMRRVRTTKLLTLLTVLLSCWTKNLKYAIGLRYFWSEASLPTGSSRLLTISATTQHLSWCYVIYCCLCSSICLLFSLFQLVLCLIQALTGNL